MDVTAIQSDKVLLTVFVSVLVGFITAALSIVRLVNDKENKTTDYRQAWNDSLRKCFAELISNINLLAYSITSRLTAADRANEITEQAIKQEEKKSDLSPSLNNLRDFFDRKLFDEESHIRELRKNLHQSYALTSLHFKPNDLSFSRVEQKFGVIIGMIDRLSSLQGDEALAERSALREKIQTAALELAGYSRDILKTEWEAVKKGERAYQQTKRWSLIGGGIALFVLLVFGAVTTWSMARSDAGKLPERRSHLPVGQSNVSVGSTSPIPSSAPQNSQVVNVYPSVACPTSSDRGPKMAKRESPACPVEEK